MKSINFSFYNLIIIAFIIVFVIFNIIPTYFIGDVMNNFTVPQGSRVGMDIKDAMWLSNMDGRVQYTPLADLLLQFAYSLNRPKLIYIILTMVTLFMVFVANFYILPKLFDIPKKIIFFLFPVLLFSYGFIFEIERGQYNLIVIILFLYAALLYKNNRIFLASLIAAISVNLKIYPFIFVVFLIQDYSSLKRVLIKLLPFFGLCFFFLIFRGWDVLYANMDMYAYKSVNPTSWVGNHSILSFVNYLGSLGFKVPVSVLGFLIIYLLTILGIFIVSLLKKHKGIEGHIVLVAVVGSLIIPSISHDYKLSLLTIIFPVYYSLYYNTKSRVNLTFVFVISILFFSTFYSYENAFFLPEYLRNKFIILILIAILVNAQYLFNNIQFLRNK